MRHQRVINHLGRTSSHRKAMLANMAASLILHKRISTTTAKAKALRSYIEPLITKSKEDSTHSRRLVFSYLKDKDAVAILFREVSPKIAERPGGYTRILKTGNRIGDNADMCILELVDFNENMLGGEAAKTKTTRRRRATPKKKTDGEETKAITKKATPKGKKAESPEEEVKETPEKTDEEKVKSK
jgi:large subunit ribosomal protein L17